MIFGPVLPVELVTTSRRARYFVVRVLYAAVLLVTLWVQYESTFGIGRYTTYQQRVAEFATEFFRTFAVVQVLAVLVLTPPMVAGTIAEEKDRKTIEYLLVTDLKNGEIVLGKLGARLLHLLGQIAVGVPVLALTMLLGGVGLESLLAAFAVTLATLLTVAGLSIWTSVQARRGRDAVTRVFVIGLALLLLPPLASWFPWAVGALQELLAFVMDPLMDANPFVCLSRVLRPPGPDWLLIGKLVRNQAVLAVPCTVLAVWQVRRAYLRQTYGQAARPRRERFRLWRPALGTAPMAWKEMYAERPVASLGVLGMAAQAILVLAVLVPTLWIFFLVVSGGGGTWRWDRDDFRIYVTIMATAVACVGILLTAIRSATSVTAERERQTWEVLLSTPLEGREIVLGKLLGSLYAARGLGAILLVLWGLGVVAGSILPFIVPVVAGELAVIAVCAATIGLLFSLRIKSSLWSMAATAGTCLFVGGGYLFCCIPFLVRSGATEFVLAGCVPFLLGFPMAMEPGRLHPTEEELVATCFVGVIIYFLAMLAQLAVAVNNFDEMAGRVVRAPYRWPSPARPVAHVSPPAGPEPRDPIVGQPIGDTAAAGHDGHRTSPS